MNATIFIFLLFSLSFLFFFSIKLCVDYGCHVSFSKQRFRDRFMDCKGYDKGTFKEVKEKFLNRKWAKLHSSLFVSDSQVDGHSCLSESVILFSDRAVILGPIDYLKYRRFLRSDVFKEIPKPEYWR